MDARTLEDVEIEGKKVLVRTDYNIPMDKEGNITDDKRIRDSIPTIQHLLKNGAKQIIILTHIGRPKENEERLKTDKAAKRLSELIQEQVKKIDEWGEEGLPEDKIIVLENARFSSKEKSREESERDEFAKSICRNADIFVMEAFSNMHRGKEASMTSTLKFLPACIGKAAEKEIKTIDEAIRSPKRPLISIMGGAKADKLSSVENLLQNSDKILLGGALAFNIFHGMGYNTGDSKIDEENIEKHRHIIEKLKENKKIILPEDAVVADNLSNNAEKKTVSITDIKEGWMALDIGPETVNKFKEEIKKAGTIIWNGPLGLFEIDNFARGTEEIAKSIAESQAFSIIGGGDSASAISKCNLTEKVGFVSSGGGASLAMFEGKKLPVLEKLEKNKEIFN